MIQIILRMLWIMDRNSNINRWDSLWMIRICLHTLQYHRTVKHFSFQTEQWMIQICRHIRQLIVMDRCFSIPHDLWLTRVRRRTLKMMGICSSTHHYDSMRWMTQMPHHIILLWTNHFSYRSSNRWTTRICRRIQWMIQIYRHIRKLRCRHTQIRFPRIQIKYLLTQIKCHPILIKCRLIWICLPIQT